jgi:hypothetical protein
MPHRGGAIRRRMEWWGSKDVLPILLVRAAQLMPSTAESLDFRLFV